MGETPIDGPDSQGSAPGSSPSAYQEYGDALSDILKDQARRTELRAREGPSSGPRRIPPAIPPALALFSIWLWMFPPAALIPDVPFISPVSQEAGLRMGMYMLRNDIQSYVSEHGRLPTDLRDVGDGPESIGYMRLSGNVFQLSGRAGDITVEYTSTEPVEDLLANSIAVISGTAPSASEGEPSI